jgi:hypothetical protein
VGTDLGRARDLTLGRWAAPPRFQADHLVDVEHLSRTHSDRAPNRRDVQDIAGLAVRCRSPDPQPAALPDGERVSALVGADNGTGVVDDLAGSRAEVTAEEAAVLPSAMKQMSWLSGFSATASPAVPPRTNGGLRGSAKREHGAGDRPAVSTPST